MDEAIDGVAQIAATSRRINPDLLTICHGGPFGEPEAVVGAIVSPSHKEGPTRCGRALAFQESRHFSCDNGLRQ